MPNLNAAMEWLNRAGLAHWQFASAMFWQSALLVAVLAVADYALRKRLRPVVRYWMWALVLVKLLLPVTLSSPFSIAYWTVSQPAATPVVETKVEQPVPVVKRPVAVVETPSASLQTLPPELAPDAAPRQTEVSDVRPVSSPPPAQLASVPIAQPIQSPASTSTSTVASEKLVMPDRFGVLLIVWIAGVLTLGTLVASRTRRVWRLVTQSTDAPAEMSRNLQEACRLLKLTKGRVRVRISDEVGCPAVCGFWRPTILIPERLLGRLTDEQFQLILVHELAHWKRGDLQVNLLQTLLQIVYFYNPCVWFANSRLRQLREEAVDDMVLVAGMAHVSSYSETLLDVAAQTMRPVEVSIRLIGILESRASLTKRIRRMVLGGIPRTARLGIWGLAAVAIFGIGLLPMAGGPAASSADPKEAVPQAGAEKKAVGPPVAGEAGRKDELRGRRKRTAIDAAAQFDGKANFSGFVLDEAEKPVTDARIEIQPADGGLHQSVKVDEKGYFQFQQVRAGTYWLSIISKRCIGINNRGRLPELNLGAGSDTIRDFHLKISRQARVTVVDEKQQPLEGVQFFRKGDDFDLDFVGKSDADGMALLEGLQSSESDVTFAAMKKDFAIGRLSLRLKDPKSVPEAKLTLSKGISISGTAICSDGKPAKGMRLNVAPSWLRTALYGGQQTVGEDGSFTFHNISRDPQHVTVYIQTGESFETKTLLTDADLFNHRGPLKLKINYPSPDSLGYIEGRVEYAKGKPTKGYFLYAEHEDRKNRSSASHYIKLNQETFRLGPLPAGRYQLSDGASEFVPRELPIIAAPAKDVRLTFEYRGKRVVHGRVMRGDDGTPFNDFRVRLVGVSSPPFRRQFHGSYMRWVDVNHPRGEFSLELLDPGTFKVEAVAEGYVNVVSIT